MPIREGRAVMDERVADFLKFQQACLAYTLPPDHVVYETDPVRAAGLLGQPGYIPLPYRLDDPSHPPVAVWQYEPWFQYARMIFGAARSTLPAVFVGGRATPGGDERLVVIEIDKNMDSTMIFS